MNAEYNQGDVIAAFLDAMRALGLEPVGTIQADDELHRVSWKDDRKNSRNGAYVLHMGERPAGWFGCWKRNIDQKWCFGGQKLTKEQRQDYSRKAAEERKRRQTEKENRHIAVANLAKRIWNSAKKAEKHPYLTRKAISGDGCRLGSRGQLLVPLCDASGQIQNLQIIWSDGTKRFIKGGRVSGLFCRLGSSERQIVITEGFSTAASIRQATETAVVVAFNAGNLASVTKSVSKAEPSAELLIAGDDDHLVEGNPGKSKALEAAAGVGARVVFPAFCDEQDRGTDFNDLALLESYSVVKSQILAGWQSEPVENAPGHAKPVEERGWHRVVRVRQGRHAPGLYRKADGDVWIRFASLIEIEAETRNTDGEDWGRLILVRDRDGIEHRWAMPMSMLAGDGAAYRERLLSIGAELVPGTAAKNALHDYLSTWRPDKRLRAVDRTGWHDGVFVMPDRNFGPKDAGEITLQGATAAPVYAEIGTLDDWKANIGIPATGNSRLVLSICAALAGPMLQPLSEESGGFHLAGSSSTGKTTTLHVAGTVWGSSIQSWRVTDNGAENLAAGHSDTLLLLDEIGQADTRAVDQLAYMLANGAGKARMRRDTTTRPVSRWRVLFLSTGELGLADKLHEDGKRARGGQSVRVIELPADAGIGFGCFEELHDQADADSFARSLRLAAPLCQGAIGRAFLERFTADIEVARKRASEMRAEWVEDNLPLGAPGQVSRVCGRFGLVAAAGELAIEWNLVPWMPGEATNAAIKLFNAWLDQRGGTMESDIREGLRAVRWFIERHGSSRFENAWAKTSDDPSGTSRPIVGGAVNRAGFRRLEGKGDEAEWQYFVLPEVWRQDICKGFNSDEIAKSMIEKGWMMAGDGRNLAFRTRIPGHGSQRLYFITQAFMSAWGNRKSGSISNMSEQSEQSEQR